MWWVWVPKSIKTQAHVSGQYPEMRETAEKVKAGDDDKGVKGKARL